MLKKLCMITKVNAIGTKGPNTCRLVCKTQHASDKILKKRLKILIKRDLIVVD